MVTGPKGPNPINAVTLVVSHIHGTCHLPTLCEHRPRQSFESVGIASADIHLIACPIRSFRRCDAVTKPNAIRQPCEQNRVHPGDRAVPR